VKYYADGVTPEGYPYLIMEFVDGMTLKEALKRRKVWPIEESCELILQLCDAFGGLHQLGVVHRDVKPDNIMLTRNHQVKLMDLGLIKDAQGLCKLLESEDIMEGKDFADNLDKGVLAGTPEYMAPEQFSDPSLADESQSKTDTWTDVYSLGLIFYEMLVGKKLFVFNPPVNAPQSEFAKALLAFLTMRTQQRDEEIIPPPNIPFQLWTVIARALHADPTLRQRNASEFAEDLHRFMLTGEGVVEQDSDKTSAIDLSRFSDVLRKDAGSNNGIAMDARSGNPELYASSQQGFQQPMNSQGLPMQGVSGLPNIPGTPGYVAPYEEEESDGNFWLWIILIILLVIVAGGLIVMLLYFE
jgi:serine/threonine protein kinase